MYSNKIVMHLVSSEWLQQSLQMTKIARKSIGVNRHIIICGYGRCGQNLARILEKEGIPYIALDLDPDRVQQAGSAGDSVVFGDASRLQALMASGLARASAVVITYQDTAAAFKVLANTRTHAPQVPVIVRTQDDHDLQRLQAAGATEVVPEAIEGSLMLASHALALVGVPMRRVIRIVQDQRDARYTLLRGFFHGADDSSIDDLQHDRLVTVSLPVGSKANGKVLGAFGLQSLEVSVVSLRRSGGNASAALTDTVLLEGDTMVLSGKADMLSLAESRLLQGLAVNMGP
jgi:CPA2 family monovalent cation:H+ antiporter-2